MTCVLVLLVAAGSVYVGRHWLADEWEKLRIKAREDIQERNEG